MQDKYEVLTMERLHDLISEACECISVANNKTKVKLRKIIQNEAFEFLNGEPSDLIKAIDILWSEQPNDAVVIKTINEWKLEGIKVIEDENLVIKIINKENVCDETRRSFPGSYDYIVEVYLKGYTTIVSKDFSMVECIELLVSCGCLEGRADSTIGEALNGYGKRIYSFAEEFCLINKVELDVREKLLKVAKVNYILTKIIISDCQKRLIEDSNYVEIVDSLKSLYEQEMNIKPREKGFKFYLEGIFEIYNLHSDDILMIHLAEYVVSEKQKNINFIQEAKDKQQTIIDITPHQTLSIETAAAVEEGKKEFDFKRFAEVANGMVNEYGERDEDLCKEYEEIRLSEGYKEWLMTLPTSQEVIEQQNKESKEYYSKIVPNSSGLRSKTGTFEPGYRNDWIEELACMAFHYFRKNINKPLTIKQIQANLFSRHSELDIIGLLDDLVGHLEIEYTKEKIDNEDIYRIEPLEMFLWKTTDKHFLSKKLRREVIIEIVEKVRTNVYDRHYQKAKKEIETDVLTNFHNPIEEIKERIETVRNKLDNRLTFYYKVDDIDKFVEMIQNRHLGKHYTNDKTEDIEVIEWELNKMFKFQSWIDCGNNKLRELLSIKPTTSTAVEKGKAECEIFLQHQEIGLLYYYDELPLKEYNAQKIAERYGQTSGSVLLRHFRSVSNSETQRRNHKYAKKYLETVIPLLTKKEGIEKAKRDLANVKTPKK